MNEKVSADCDFSLASRFDRSYTEIVSNEDAHTERDKVMTNKMQAVAEYRVALAAQFDAREAYEMSQRANVEKANMNIFKTLKSLRDDFKTDIVCEVMHTANVDVAFINRQERENKRFNVYAAEKVANIARSAVNAEALKSYTRLIFLTALNLTKADKTMTHADAQASLCVDLKADAAKDAHIVRYAKRIAANTADTQSSSSINALQMYNVLIETRDETNAVAYKLNLTSATTKKLAKHLSVSL